MCLQHGIAGQIGGTTPGKRIMGIKVVMCDRIVVSAQDNNKVVVTPAKDIGFTKWVFLSIQYVLENVCDNYCVDDITKKLLNWRKNIHNSVWWMLSYIVIL